MSDARTWRDGFLKRAEGSGADQVLCGELLDDVLRHVEENGKASTAKIWKLVVDANLRPFFGNLMLAERVNTLMQEQ